MNTVRANHIKPRYWHHQQLQRRAQWRYNIKNWLARMAVAAALILAGCLVCGYYF